MNTTPETKPGTIEALVRRAFGLGQTYWQQSDSDYVSQNRKADITMATYRSEVLATAQVADVERADDARDLATSLRAMLVLANEVADAMRETALHDVTVRDVSRGIDHELAVAKARLAAWEARA